MTSHTCLNSVILTAGFIVSPAGNSKWHQRKWCLDCENRFVTLYITVHIYEAYVWNSGLDMGHCGRFFKALFNLLPRKCKGVKLSHGHFHLFPFKSIICISFAGVQSGLLKALNKLIINEIHNELHILQHDIQLQQLALCRNLTTVWKWSANAGWWDSEHEK